MDGQNKYDSKTLHVDADFFKCGEKNIRFRKYPATCGQGLSRTPFLQKPFYIYKNTRLKTHPKHAKNVAGAEERRKTFTLDTVTTQKAKGRVVGNVH